MYSWNDFDDGRDYTAVLLARMNGVGGLRVKPDGEVPKPVGKAKPVAKPVNTGVKCANIGKRVRYSRDIMTGIYQLHRRDKTPEEIARLTDIPLRDVNALLRHSTELQGAIWKRVKAQPESSLPTPEVIITRMARELAVQPTVNPKRRK